MKATPESRLLPLLIAFSSPALGVPILFNGWGAGQFALVTNTSTVNLDGTVNSGTSNMFDEVIGVGAGKNLALAGGTASGSGLVCGRGTSPIN